MKALTIHQPYASLIAVGAKRYETRSWATRYRGPIAIHAGTKEPRFPIPEYSDFGDAMCYALGSCSYWGGNPPKWCDAPNAIHFRDDEFPRGGVIAIADLVECHEIDYADYHNGLCPIGTADGNSFMLTKAEFLFGNWTPGRFAWELANVKRLPVPVPCKGRQGLWNWEGML